MLAAGTPNAPGEAQDCCHGHHGRHCAGPTVAAPAATQGGAGSATGPLYDPDTVATLRGTATTVTTVPARGGRSGGIHVALEAEGATTDVHLGPAWFLKDAGLEVAKGDAIEVLGSIVEVDGATFLIARDLTKGSKVVHLRDERGVPLWSGRARR
jgi:hypothetical protein